MFRRAALCLSRYKGSLMGILRSATPVTCIFKQKEKTNFTLRVKQVLFLLLLIFKKCSRGVLIKAYASSK